MTSFINMNEVWAELLIQAPGLILALLMLWGLYRLLRDFGIDFIQAQKDQAVSMSSQAKSMTGLTRSIGEFIQRDNGDHAEMRILMKLSVSSGERIKGTLGKLTGSISQLTTNVEGLRREVKVVKGETHAD